MSKTMCYMKPGYMKPLFQQTLFQQTPATLPQVKRATLGSGSVTTGSASPHNIWPHVLFFVNGGVMMSGVLSRGDAGGVSGTTNIFLSLSASTVCSRKHACKTKHVR